MRRKVEEGVCEVDLVDPLEVAAARAALARESIVKNAAHAFQTLANPGRLRILFALEGRELCVCDIAEVLGLSMSATSHQLRELRHLGAVEFRVDGKLAYYTLSDPFWLDVARSVIGRFAPVASKPGRNKDNGPRKLRRA